MDMPLEISARRTTPTADMVAAGSRRCSAIGASLCESERLFVGRSLRIGGSCLQLGDLRDPLLSEVPKG